MRETNVRRLHAAAGEWTCDFCGGENDDTFARCPLCSRQRGESADAAPPVDVPVAAAPAGLEWTIDSRTGERHLTYAVPPAAADVQEPAVQAGPDVWPKRLMAGGGAAAAVVAAVGYAGPGLTAAGHAVEAAGIGVGLTAAGVGALAILAKGAFGGGRDRSVNVSVNVTATGGSASSSATAGKRGRR